VQISRQGGGPLKGLVRDQGRGQEGKVFFYYFGSTEEGRWSHTSGLRSGSWEKRKNGLFVKENSTFPMIGARERLTARRSREVTKRKAATSKQGTCSSQLSDDHGRCRRVNNPRTYIRGARKKRKSTPLEDGDLDPTSEARSTARGHDALNGLRSSRSGKGRR